MKELKRINNALLKKYNDDEKFVRIHKRIAEENYTRKQSGNSVLISRYDDDILNILIMIKNEIDKKVYDRNDILKKDAYFEQTVMTLVSNFIEENNINTTRDDRLFIQRKISKEYLEQYKDYYNN